MLQIMTKLEGQKNYQTINLSVKPRLTKLLFSQHFNYRKNHIIYPLSGRSQRITKMKKVDAMAEDIIFEQKYMTSSNCQNRLWKKLKSFFLFLSLSFETRCKIVQKSDDFKK